VGVRNTNFRKGPVGPDRKDYVMRIPDTNDLNTFAKIGEGELLHPAGM